MSLSNQQSGVIRAALTGGVIAVVVAAVATFLFPELLPASASLADRLENSLKADTFIALYLGASIIFVSSYRFNSPTDIDGAGLSEASDGLRILRANLQNTLEQTVLAIMAHTAWAILMPAKFAIIIWVATGSFVVGRILFLRGYKNGAPGRSLGYMLTFFPSLLMLIAVAICILLQSF